MERAKLIETIHYYPLKQQFLSLLKQFIKSGFTFIDIQPMFLVNAEDAVKVCEILLKEKSPFDHDGEYYLENEDEFYDIVQKNHLNEIIDTALINEFLIRDCEFNLHEDYDVNNFGEVILKYLPIVEDKCRKQHEKEIALFPIHQEWRKIIF